MGRNFLKFVFALFFSAWVTTFCGNESDYRGFCKFPLESDFCKGLYLQPKHTSHRPPILTTAAIIEIYQEGKFEGIVLIERGKPPWGKALPGGKVEIGETVEKAIRREMQEEVHLDLQDLKQFHVYSDPARDFRHHSIEVTHLARAYAYPTAGDDAAKAWVVKIEDIPWDHLAFDHATILRDYLSYRKGTYFDQILRP